MNYKKLQCIVILSIIPAITWAESVPSDSMPCKFNMTSLPPAESGEFRHIKGERLPPYLHDITLSDTQKESIKALMQKNDAVMKDIHKTAMQNTIYTKSQVFSDQYSEEKIAALIKKTLPYHEQMALNITKLDRAIYELLSPEQQQEVNKHLADLSKCLTK